MRPWLPEESTTEAHVRTSTRPKRVGLLVETTSAVEACQGDCTAERRVGGKSCRFLLIKMQLQEIERLSASTRWTPSTRTSTMARLGRAFYVPAARRILREGVGPRERRPTARC
jgi:hypothetical protein